MKDDTFWGLFVVFSGYKCINALTSLPISEHTGKSKPELPNYYYYYYSFFQKGQIVSR
jgi:hypothetical protein